MNMNIKEACESVAELFEAIPEIWTVGSLARDEHGGILHPTSANAVQWCAIGGVLAALDADYLPEVWDVLNPIAAALGYDRASVANNEGGREVAIKMLRLAAQS